MRIPAIIFLCFFLFTCWSLASGLDHSSYESVKKCRKCHKQALPGHKLAKPKNLPAGLPLDATGRMFCHTCHDCITGTCTLRRQSPELCRVCHDCTTGMACFLDVAHMGNPKNAVKSDIKNCLGCHDGFFGKSIGGPKDHKVDIFYIRGKNFNRISDRRIILVDGRVKCITCHDPYKNEGKRLSISNEGSRLCLTCHRK